MLWSVAGWRLRPAGDVDAAARWKIEGSSALPAKEEGQAAPLSLPVSQATVWNRLVVVGVVVVVVVVLLLRRTKMRIHRRKIWRRRRPLLPVVIGSSE